MSAQQIPIHEGLFTWPSKEPSLLGSCCCDCGEYFFPVQTGCSNCSSQNLKTVELGNKGTLWTWTIQGFIPKPPYSRDETPETFQPFGVGYIEMPCGVKVEARLKENCSDDLRIGMPMQLCIEKLRTDETGNELMIFVFEADK